MLRHTMSWIRGPYLLAATSPDGSAGDPEVPGEAPSLKLRATLEPPNNTSHALRNPNGPTRRRDPCPAPRYGAGQPQRHMGPVERHHHGHEPNPEGREGYRERWHDHSG